jgi:hypothetical protein
LGVEEGNDSTPKKLIFLIPFDQQDKIHHLLGLLEQQVGAVAYIDVEMNTLEDAYINIVKAE